MLKNYVVNNYGNYFIYYCGFSIIIFISYINIMSFLNKHLYNGVFNIFEYYKYRDNHIKHYNEFNKIDQDMLTINDIVIFAKKLSLEKNVVRILELGTKRSDINIPTNKKSLFQEISNIEYVMTDYSPGIDVDVVADLHKIDTKFNKNYFDIILSCSTYEHLKYPQLCSHNLMKILNIEGIIYIQTHQTFPLHGYKYDYFRFSRESLKAIFSNKMNMSCLSTYYTNICAIMPHTDYGVWNDVAESYMNVVSVFKKIGETPDVYIYDIEEDTSFL